MEPFGDLEGVIGVRASDGERDLVLLYEASYARLVRTLTLVADDRHQAEEAVQEAFARLIGRWPQISNYEDPEAWVRSVAFGRLSNIMRKSRNGRRALERLGRPNVASPPSADAADIEAALRRLPMRQRQVVVLHYLVGLDLPAISRELNTPIGTVKSRLSRAREALRPLLTEEEQSHA